ncbi:SMP-30/gluconolactonase/LRE family protein [Dyadobacter tibetensis]|uniref:SMP-30/gluconolactonase/LRE family protein n=1 Tax=Dyadobacter tibetensis TaxID=1211851 RepID=UPI00046E7B31|nr:ATP/GTP-binding protein [Dyadobacter tibetensis]
MKKRYSGLAAAAILFLGTLAQAQPNLTKIWETKAELPVPESVLYSAKDKLLYVSNIDGQAGEKDGKGSIAKVGLDGKIIDSNWVSGLNAPKGMGKMGYSLYVTDIDHIVEIHTKTGKILNKYPVEGAKFLNDLTIDAKGNIFFTDMQTKKIHKLYKGQVSTYHENLTRPNGILALGTDLLIADNGVLKRLSGPDKLTVVAEGMDPSSDGIEEIRPGEYLVSCWAGLIYLVKSDGSVEKLLDTSAQKINSADIGYDNRKKIVYVPTFLKNSVVAYQLK